MMFLTPLAFSTEGENEMIGNEECLLLLIIDWVREGEHTAWDQ